MFLKIIQMKNILLENKKLSETFESSQFHDEYIWTWISLENKKLENISGNIQIMSWKQELKINAK